MENVRECSVQNGSKIEEHLPTQNRLTVNEFCCCLLGRSFEEHILWINSAGANTSLCPTSTPTIKSVGACFCEIKPIFFPPKSYFFLIYNHMENNHCGRKEPRAARIKREEEKNVKSGV